MPEIKNNFIQGKMNKDLDDRLLPNGQYRDGFNIRISKSENSDVGTVQNVKGNDYASGSATLEAAIFGTPMVIVYKMSSLSWIFSKLLVKTKYAGMVNIIAGKKIVPEYLQNKATITSISKECLNIINNQDIYKKMKK